MSINLYENNNEATFTVGGAKSDENTLTEGKRYEFEITELNLRKDVVSFAEGVPEHLRNRDYAKLAPELKAEVDKLDLGTTKTGEPKSKLYNKLNVVAKEVVTGRSFFYDIEFSIFGGRVGIKFLDFVRKVTGEILERDDDVNIASVLPQGTLFTAELTRRGKDKFLHIDQSTIGPSGKMAEYEALSANAKTLLAGLKPYNGKTKMEILAYIEAGQVGNIPVDDAKNALTELEGTYFKNDVLKL